MRRRFDYNVHQPATGDELWTGDLAAAMAWWLAHPCSRLVRHRLDERTGETSGTDFEVLLTGDDFERLMNGEGLDARKAAWVTVALTPTTEG